jgi:hypothetical protein
MMQIEAPSFFSSLDQSVSRSTATNGSPSFLCYCGPPTKKDARPRTRDTREARSPATRKKGGGAVVENGERCRSRRERERESGVVKK